MGALREILATRVRLARQAKGWTQEELADRTGLSVRYIGQLERHQTSASVDVLEQIAGAFGVSPPELLAPVKFQKKRRPPRD